jgi:hypothetical protein
MDISSAVSLLAALSVASERLVEIVKGSIPWLKRQRGDPAQEGWRQAALHLLAAAAGIATAMLANAAVANAVPPALAHPPGIVVIGLLASGGSGLWNSILSYMKAAKDIKETRVPAPASVPATVVATPAAALAAAN